jgi:hypothetical protein
MVSTQIEDWCSRENHAYKLEKEEEEGKSRDQR